MFSEIQGGQGSFLALEYQYFPVAPALDVQRDHCTPNQIQKKILSVIIVRINYVYYVSIWHILDGVVTENST